MSIFLFKHFSIQQANSALKIGTDAMILGSLCSVAEPVYRILDIGTGSGVLALMLAQRFNPKEIVAIEIDALSIIDASANFKNAPFPCSFELQQLQIQEYTATRKFDLIISNPPYFNNSVRNENEQVSKARHTDTLSYSELFEAFHKHLSTDGKAWFILPIESLETVTNLLKENENLHFHSINTIEGKPGKAVRFIGEIGRDLVKIKHTTFCIRDENGTYTEAYIQATSDFHDRDLSVSK